MLKTVDKQTEEIQTITSIFKIQSVALKAIHDYFDALGFIQLMPVLLSRFTDPLGPDPGSSVIKTGEIEYAGQTLQLTQSMILQKQIAIGSGIPKFYIMSPNVRLEAAHRRETGCHAFEFTQVDFEVEVGTMAEIFQLVDSLLVSIREAVESKASMEMKYLDRSLPKWESKFPVYTTHELEDKYGEEWERLSSLETQTPYWVVCHDREFYDKADRSREGKHFLNYDLYYPEGFGEALSGAEREHDYKHILERITEDELPVKPYQDYLKRAKKGLILPSAGGGIGVERLVRFLTGAKHIGDVQLFRRIPGEAVVI
jgi:asparaginyl-tRNA synthetase